MYDVIFIGSGHAAWHGAAILALAGKKVAIVEEDLTGGTCTNYGCDAKITLDGPFEFLEGIQNYGDLCVDTVPGIDWKKLMEYKKRETNDLYKQLDSLIESFGIELIKGHGSIIDNHTVRVGNQHLSAEYIVIATGQRNARLEVPGKEYLHDSRDFLGIEEMPEHIVFIGAGIISMEFASMVIKLGKSITIIEYSDRALRQYPAEYVSKLVEKMTAEGVCFRFNEGVCQIEKTDKGYTVKTKSGLAVECDYVLDATGRVANYENLGLENVGIEACAKGIVVNDHLQTSVPNIYASGDIICKSIPKLTPTAEFESNYIADQILGSKEPICYPVVPNLVFTLPRIAQAGVTVEEAKMHPELYNVYPFMFGKAMLWLAKNEKDAEALFIVDKQSYLVGAALYCNEAGMWIDFLTLVINQKLRGSDLKKMIFGFPTATYALTATLITLLVPSEMTFKAIKFFEKGFVTQGFAMGGEEGADKFDNSLRYRSCLTNYLIDTGTDVILVDTGMPEGAPETIPDEDTMIYTGRWIKDYVSALKDTGYTPDQVTKILVTHKHEDHSGELRSFPNAKIYISPEDADALGLEGDNIVRVLYKDGPYKNFAASEKIADGVYFLPAKGHTYGNSIVIAESGGLFYMFHGDLSYTDEAMYEDKLSVVFDDIELARETQNIVREFIRNNPTVYVSTHSPLGYENLEAKRVMDLDNPPETVPIDYEIEAKTATGKYVCSVCGYVYDPAEHDGVAFEDLPEDWLCPRCKQGKDKYNRA